MPSVTFQELARERIVSSEAPLPITLIGPDSAGVYQEVQTVQKDGKTSFCVVNGLSDTQTMHLNVGTSSTLIAFMLVDISITVGYETVA